VVDPHPLVERVEVWVIDDLDHVVEPVLDDRRGLPSGAREGFEDRLDDRIEITDPPTDRSYLLIKLR